jgi:hypothetical protein
MWAIEQVKKNRSMISTPTDAQPITSTTDGRPEDVQTAQAPTPAKGKKLRAS